MAEHCVKGAWTRKHDDPRHDLIPHAECIVYPRSLADLITICRDREPAEHLKAAGSHWALSTAAVSDHTFIETHDPRDAFQAMGKTLTNVVPGCLTIDYVRHMLRHTASDEQWYLAHVEAGKRIYQLYAELDQPVDLNDESTLGGFINKRFGNPRFAGPWAFETLGGAGGQTVVGALNTGTHGGDFDRPPVSDSVLAIHLVADGGRHYWIEPVTRGVPQMTDDDRLRAQFETTELGGSGNFEIIRNNDVFDAVLVSVGRFGAIYSIVVRALPQYALRQTRELSLWSDVKEHIKNPASFLYRAEPNQRFLQVAVCLTTQFNFHRNLVGITRRWTRPMAAGTPGKAERVGTNVGFSDHLQAPRFTLAGHSLAYNPDDDHPERAAPPSMLELACADSSFLKGILTQVKKELEDFVASHGAIVGPAIAAVAALTGGGALLLLIPALLLILAIVVALLDAFDDDTRFAETMNHIKDQLLNPPSPDPLARAAGLFTWQLIVFLAFRSQQSEQDYTAVSYAVMDSHDYLNTSCDVNVESVEVFFDATDDRLITFIDTLIAFEMNQEFHGKAFAGYASMRFMRPTRALIGMQRWPLTCGVEVACLKDVTGGTDLIDFAVAWARNPNSGAILHWGQRNDAVRAEIERIFDTDLSTWREALTRVHGDTKDGFSSAFTRRTGLEVV